MPEAEKAERARAAVVLLLGLYGMTVMPWAPSALAWAFVALSPAVLSYAVHKRVAHVLYWAWVTCINPLGYGMAQAMQWVPPWDPLAAPQGYLAAALFFGLTRLLGFGGRYPMAVAATQGPPAPL